jgi:hypothetical protein
VSEPALNRRAQLSAFSLQALGGQLKPDLRRTPIQIQVVLGQGSADLLMIVVILLGTLIGRERSAEHWLTTL